MRTLFLAKPVEVVTVAFGQSLGAWLETQWTTPMVVVLVNPNLAAAGSN